jgi:aminomethyltransferase
MGTLAGFDNVVLSATGYTGEKGFELYFDKNLVDPEAIWEAIVEAGKEFDIEPCGLGARDTLRLEKGFALYGNDITKDTHPLEARMGWLTKLDKGDFIGRDALLEAKENGLDRKLVGLTLDDKRAIPRKGYTILDADDNEIGFVTSGSRSITLGKNIGMGYVAIEHADEGDVVFVEIRNKKAEATVVKPPFVK